MSRRWRDFSVAQAAAAETQVRRRAPYTQHEYLEQCALMQWCETQYFRIEADRRVMEICLHDVTVASLNGAYLSGDARMRAIQWSKLKRAGAKKSEPDISINVPMGKFHGMKIELKRCRNDFATPSELRNAIRPGQEEMLTMYRRLGYQGVFAYGWIDAAVQICDYFGWNARSKGLS